ncbi:MAG: DNA N-6-adenine-methyltransferase [Planctomycetota bacterium]
MTIPRKAAPERSEFFTPERVLERVRVYFGGAIPLDPATTPSNPTGATRCFSMGDDGLRQSWNGAGVFVSPPAGSELRPWVEKIGCEAMRGVEIVALLPASSTFGNAYWQDAVLTDRLRALCWVRRKVPFRDASGARVPYPYSSVLLGLNTASDRFREAFAPLGMSLALTKIGGPA